MSANLETLPTELQCHIAHHCDIPSLGILPQLNHHFKEVSKVDGIWQQFYPHPPTNKFFAPDTKPEKERVRIIHSIAPLLSFESETHPCLKDLQCLKDLNLVCATPPGWAQQLEKGPPDSLDEKTKLIFDKVLEQCAEQSKFNKEAYETLRILEQKSPKNLNENPYLNLPSLINPLHLFMLYNEEFANQNLQMFKNYFQFKPWFIDRISTSTNKGRECCRILEGRAQIKPNDIACLSEFIQTKPFNELLEQKNLLAEKFTQHVQFYNEMIQAQTHS